MYDENDIRELIKQDLEKKMPGVTFSFEDIKIEVKSKQNYRSEWESAAFRATVQSYAFKRKGNEL